MSALPFAPVLGTGIVQVCYVVPDLDAACEGFHRAFGMGPFRGGAEFALEDHRYHGAAQPPIRGRGVFGWSAGLCIEVLEVVSQAPSAFHDMLAEQPAGAPFVHHVATFAADYEGAKAAMVAAGYPIASAFNVPVLDVEICYADTRALCGHMVEIYPENAGIRAMYAEAEATAGDWSRGRLILPWGE